MVRIEVHHDPDGKWYIGANSFQVEKDSSLETVAGRPAPLTRYRGYWDGEGWQDARGGAAVPFDTRAEADAYVKQNQEALLSADVP